MLDINAIKADLRRSEGKVLKVYLCPAGARTVGYGHNIDAHALPGYISHYLAKHGVVTDDMAEYLLELDLQDAIAAAKNVVKPETFEWLSERQRAVLVEMAFILGEGGLSKFKRFLAALDAHDINQAARHLRDSKFYRQLGGDPEGTDDGVLERPERLIRQLREG